MDRKFPGDLVCLAIGVAHPFAFSMLVAFGVRSEFIVNAHDFRAFGIPSFQLMACAASACLASAGLLWFMSYRRGMRVALFVAGALVAWFAFGLYLDVALDLLIRVWAYWVSIAVAVCIALAAAKFHSSSRHVIA